MNYEQGSSFGYDQISGDNTFDLNFLMLDVANPVKKLNYLENNENQVYNKLYDKLNADFIKKDNLKPYNPNIDSNQSIAAVQRRQLKGEMQNNVESYYGINNEVIDNRSVAAPSDNFTSKNTKERLDVNDPEFTNVLDQLIYEQSIDRKNIDELERKINILFLLFVVVIFISVLQRAINMIPSIACAISPDKLVNSGSSITKEYDNNTHPASL
jgi:hypothetical protein